MKLTKTKTEIKEARDFEGLFTYEMVHELKSSRGSASYKGPFIPPDEWQKVLAFFAWTHQEMNSESQVRMYVNPKLWPVRFWPHPQKAQTGLSAEETDQTTEERQADDLRRFASWGVAPSADWIMLGTAHHHCGIGAFQSGTDEANEKGQDGLHLTVGDMDKEIHSLHARFYQGGYCFEPDMSEFWDVGEPWKSSPFVDHDGMARYQMATATGGIVPEEWKANVIKQKITLKPFPERTPSYNYLAAPPDNSYGPNQPGDKGAHKFPVWMRLEAAAKEIGSEAAAMGISMEEVMSVMYQLCECVPMMIFDACLKHEVDIEELLQEMSWDVVGQERERRVPDLDDDPTMNMQ